MIRRLLPGLTLAFFLLFTSKSSVGSLVANAQGNPGAEILQLINQFRASQGLPPFEYNGALALAAQNHANWMAANLTYSHYGAGGSTPQSRAISAGFNGYVVENIVGGTNMSPRQGLIWWQNSPIHYNTLVTSRYPQAGVGFATNDSQNMYVLVVGRPPGPFEEAATTQPAPRSAAPLIITPIELAEPREDGSIVHVIQEGQALWTIAAYYDVDLDYLYLINGLTESDILHPGYEVTVRLADGQEPPPTPTPPLTQVVREGDSAWSIALQNGIDLDFFYLLNNMTETSVLHPGDEVTVRLAEGQSPPPTPTPRSTHIVQSGQSLWLIAALYGLSLDELMALNNLTPDSVIRQGDELIVRRATATPIPTATLTPQALASPTEISSAPGAADELAQNLALTATMVALSAETATTPSPVPADMGQQDLPGGFRMITYVILGIALFTGIALLVINRRET